MMSFSVKVTDYQKNPMLNICDSDLLDKEILGDNLKMKISKNYYGGRIVDEMEAADLLTKCNIINMVGEKTISLSTNLGIGSNTGVRIIGGVPFLIVFKM